MLRVLTCLGLDHDWQLVLLAAAVCFLTSLAAITMFHRTRAAQRRRRVGWMLTTGTVTGCGVWATHFIAELAYTPGFPVSFGIALTALSLVAAIAIISIGIAIAVFVPHRFSALVGGAIVGAGISCMHYLGMLALEIPADIIWASDLVVASVVCAVLFGAAAMRTATRGDSNLLVVIAAGLLTTSIVTLHFVAMGAVGLIPNPAHLVSTHAMSPTTLAFAIAAVTASVLGMCLVGAFSDRKARREIAARNALLDGALNNMIQGLCMFDADDRLLLWNERYREMYKIDPKAIWPGCGIRDLLNARIAASAFPLDPEAYERELRTALQQGKPFATDMELADGRTIHVLNQPIAGGGWVATHEDVTQRERAESELAQTRGFLDTVVRNVPTPLVVKSLPDLRYLLVNKAAERFFGLSAEAMIGKTPQEIFPKAQADAVVAHDREMVASGQQTYCDEHTLVTAQGETRIVTSNRLPVFGADGKPQYLIGVLHDLTQHKRDEARISYMAHHDGLTDLPNRAAFNQCLEAVSELAKKSGESFAILSIDLDRFKGVNDVFGHATGDELLRQFARRLEDAAHGAFVARVGGDEFVVISPTGPQPETAETLANRIAQVVTADFEINSQRLDTGLTMGIAIYPTDAADTVTLVANADAALYRAKTEARGSIRFFEPDMDDELREKRALQHDLRSAIAHDELELYYQPQAQIDGEITGFEALVRWHHPRQGLVPPGTFIPLAEESGLIISLGEWILRTACREAASWPNALRIAVNLSPVQFQHGDLVAMVHEILLETGLKPSRLELEITEGVLIGDLSRAVSILRRLKNIGVRIAMDDFGTGYSSLSYLQSFPFDKIKIDQSFIANLGRNPQSTAIIRAVIGLGQGLSLPVVAEGVETKEQLAFLANSSCDGIQGYLIGRPKPIAEYADIVGHRGQLRQPRAATA